jgi:hypothetical protein
MHEVLGNKKIKTTNIYQWLFPPMKIHEDQVAYSHLACPILFGPYKIQIRETVSKPSDTLSESIFSSDG